MRGSDDQPTNRPMIIITRIQINDYLSITIIEQTHTHKFTRDHEIPRFLEYHRMEWKTTNRGMANDDDDDDDSI